MATANDVKVSTRDDLRATYLLAFDSFSTDPTEVADHIGGNTRYGRELLGTLVTAGLLTEDDANGEVVWQVANPGTYDDHERDEAVTVIDEFLNRTIPVPTTQKGKTMTTTATRPKTPKNATGKCLCGCGTNSTSNYRPGHDARHAGQIARQIAGPKVTPAQATKALSALPSDALRLKASTMADRLIEKTKTPAAKVETIKANAAKANETATSTAKKATPAKPPAKPRTSTRKASAKKA